MTPHPDYWCPCDEVVDGDGVVDWDREDAPRRSGRAPVEQEIAAMIGAGAPRAEVLAGMWRYWSPNV